MSNGPGPQAAEQPTAYHATDAIRKEPRPSGSGEPARAGSTRSRPRLFTWLARLLPPVLVFIVVAAAAELYVRVAHPPRYIFQPPSAVWRALTDPTSELFGALWTTALAARVGFLASAFLGVLAAVVLTTSAWVRRALYPYTVFFQTVPIVAIAPLLVLWLDPGIRSVATCAFIVSVFPVIANTLAGLLSTDPALADLFRLYGATPAATMLKLRLPSALPNIVTGLRIAAGLAVIGTVVAEFQVGQLGDEAGLGVRIVGASHNGNLDVVFAAVLLASALGLAMFGAVNLFGHMLLRNWHASEREG
jgi:NitT/TauT family transport system permease protein